MARQTSTGVFSKARITYPLEEVLTQGLKKSN
jgi:hypothetical protein